MSRLLDRTVSNVQPGFPLASAQYVVAEEVPAPVEKFTHLRVAAPPVRRRMPALHSLGGPGAQLDIRVLEQTDRRP